MGRSKQYNKRVNNNNKTPVALTQEVPKQYKKNPYREKPLEGFLTELKLSQVAGCLCCRPLCECCCGEKTCLDFEALDDYPCQRATNIFFVVVGFLLAAFFFVFVVKMVLYLSALPPLK
jgi:hypothetical protein